MDQRLLSFEAPGAALSRAQAAIAAAQAGDWKPADEMEMDFLNDPANGIYPGCLQETDDGTDEHPNAKAYEIRRHDDGLHVMWVVPESWVNKLERCSHEEAEGNARMCDDCEGTGWKADSPLMIVETDIDGRIINEDCDI